MNVVLDLRASYGHFAGTPFIQPRLASVNDDEWPAEFVDYPRISPLTVKYECPQLSLLIITSDLETNKIEPRSYLIISSNVSKVSIIINIPLIIYIPYIHFIIYISSNVFLLLFPLLCLLETL